MSNKANLRKEKSFKNYGSIESGSRQTGDFGSRYYFSKLLQWGFLTGIENRLNHLSIIYPNLKIEQLKLLDNIAQKQINEVAETLSVTHREAANPASNNAAAEEFLSNSSYNTSKNLPITPILLWSDKKSRLGRNPSLFIKEVYGQWLGCGFSRPLLMNLDMPLYRAYAKWISPDRHPEDDLHLPTRTELIDQKLEQAGLDRVRGSSLPDNPEDRLRLRLRNTLRHREWRMSKS